MVTLQRAARSQPGLLHRRFTGVPGNLSRRSLRPRCGPQSRGVPSLEPDLLCSQDYRRRTASDDVPFFRQHFRDHAGLPCTEHDFITRQKGEVAADVAWDGN